MANFTCRPKRLAYIILSQVLSSVKFEPNFNDLLHKSMPKLMGYLLKQKKDNGSIEDY